MNVAVLSIFLLSLCLYRAESSIIDDRDNVWNLGRVPLITEWEGEHISEVVEDLCPEFQKLLQKTLDFYHRGKIDKATKMFHRILEDSADHPDILCEYGTFLEQTNTKNVSEAFHYYIYSIHKGYDQQKAIQNYLRILPKVKNFEKNLFDILDHQDAKLEAIDLGNDVALEKIHSVQQQKRVEHVFHTNAVEGNTLSFEVAKYIIENGKAPSGTFHAREVNEIWGTLEAFDYSSFVALADYIEFLELENEEPFVTLELDAHHGLLSLPPIVRDQVHHEGLLESANEHNEHLLFISQVNKMILGNVMPDDAGVFRKRDVSVGGYVPPHYTEVPLLMEKFGQWLYETEKSGVLHTVERAALAHYQLTWIHPFQDGNGRTARILMNTIMMSKGYPPVMIKLEDRENYYDALRKTQKSGDTRPFIYFIYQMALRSVEEYVQELQHLFREEVQFVPEFEPSSVPTWYISK